jgi:acyl carrier protein
VSGGAPAAHPPARHHSSLRGILGYARAHAIGRGRRAVNANGVLDRVMEIVSEVAGPGRTPSVVRPDTPLRDGGFWLHSADLLELVVACEAEFDLDFDPATGLSEVALSTAGSLAAMIASRRPNR